MLKYALMLLASDRPSSPFGSRSRTRILVALRLLDFSYPRALSRLLDSPLFAVRKALDALERDGLVAARFVGRTRVYTLSASYPAQRELAAYLSRLAEFDTDLRERVGRTAAGAAPLPRGAMPSARPVPARDAAPSTPPQPVPSPSPAPRLSEGWKNW